MKYLLYLLISVCLLEACEQKRMSSCFITDPKENLINSGEGEKLYFDDIKILQLDDAQIIQASVLALFDSLIMVNAFREGILLYNMQGQFVRKIGGVGEGPEEYNNYRKVAWNEQLKLVYVWSSPNTLLTYSLEGKCLKRIKMDLPDDFVIHDLAYYQDAFYVMNLVGMAEKAIGKRSLWLKVDTLGQIVGQKVLSLSELKLPNEGASVFSGKYCSVSKQGITYGNHYSDTIYSISELGDVPCAVWAKGDFRLTAEDAGTTYGCEGKMLFGGADEMIDKLFIRWWSFHHDKPNEHFITVCNKNTGQICTFEERIPALNATFCSLNNGRHFLIYVCEPLMLRDFLYKNGDEGLRGEGGKIDDEGNMVLVIVGLKE